MDAVAQLRATRRYLTSFLINFDINVDEMTVDTLLYILDDLADQPELLTEILNEQKRT